MVSKIKKILIVILCFTNLMAFSQSILVNNQSVNVSSDISFPYWLDSTSTLAIDSHVVSISVLEFNITSTVNGNSLVFNQAKTVTSQETVPSGKTWKVESVLLDPSFTQSNNSGTITVVSGGGGSLRPVALSNESSSTMNLGDAALYCDSLVEDGYDNWVIPTLTEILFVASGGGNIPGTRSANWLCTSTFEDYSSQDYQIVKLSDLNHTYTPYDNNKYVRCVRHAAVTVSSGGGSSSSAGSGNVVSSGLTPIAISNESSADVTFRDAALYCDSLVENGHDDWLIPTVDDLTYVSTGGLNLIRTDNYLWTRSTVTSGNIYTVDDFYVIRISNTLSSKLSSYSADYNNPPSNPYVRCIRYGPISVSSGGGSSSGGSSTPSTLGNGMPTMISNESDSSMCYMSAAIYCSNLIESGYDDWILPNYEQISYAIFGGCIFNDNRTGRGLWTRTPQGSDRAKVVRVGYYANTLSDEIYYFADQEYTDDAGVGSFCRCVR